MDRSNSNLNKRQRDCGAPGTERRPHQHSGAKRPAQQYADDTICREIQAVGKSTAPLTGYRSYTNSAVC
ncbi:MAG: hypothetical protein O7D91_17140, partial [Planctomycetota bacterium]|nr:hypothetical protein [Planctomycetota bacterium]